MLAAHGAFSGFESLNRFSSAIHTWFADKLQQKWDPLSMAKLMMATIRIRGNSDPTGRSRRVRLVSLVTSSAAEPKGVAWLHRS